jgi:hypothetical protein
MQSIGGQEEVINATKDIEGTDKPASGTSDDIVMGDDGATEKAVRRVSKAQSNRQRGWNHGNIGTANFVHAAMRLRLLAVRAAG